ncbi:hypothetical protein M409DRAFT_21955 [Zasmidium cellare ATCC 36951]|uniref:Uncharacterized protein n=1 Tax=Zasmidium cellare ATCC 36951 TaxID=1080233 RepID=A0A6A6CKM9_ZASCE|nr:uncharacterized protein M409DRAFT_21955 [Zasmidium cellare ATCC 36951]KAF2167807.1 hypothetical protein M409DRAFT_21955 [Zasmidium cellare ATCC 36951]
MANMDHENLRHLQAAFNASIDDFIKTASEDGDNKGRIAELQESITNQATMIQAELVPPITRILQMSWGASINLAARVAIDLDLFNKIPESGIGLDELVEKTGASRNIVLRILRMLTASHIVAEMAQDTYAATPVSKLLTVPELRDLIKMTHDNMHPILSATPAYLRKTGFKDMSSTANACVDLYGVPFWEAIARDPEQMAAFQSAMATQENLPPETVPQYPFSEDFSDIAPDSVHLVDVGGGRGFALRDLLDKYPDFPGRLVLQEYPSVIEDAKKANLSSRIDLMPHDATHPQPIKGAKYYYFRRVFHTWPDVTAIAALKALHGAFKKGYSKVLIQDEVIRDVGCEPQKASQDISMMMLGAMERSEGQWREVLREGGFEIVRIVRADVGGLGVIEAELVE